MAVPNFMLKGLFYWDLSGGGGWGGGGFTPGHDQTKNTPGQIGLRMATKIP